MQSTEKSFKTADRPAYLLVVDDSRAIRVGISAQLEDAGFRVDTAEDGKAALEKIYGARFDLVLLDVVMPRMDGMRVLNIIRRSYSKLELPIIMTTSRDSANDVAKALDIGANDYITKPIEPIVLKARIENQLLQKQAANYLESSREQLAREVHQRTAQLEEANRRLNYQASYDLLTGLPNRTLAHDRMDRMLREAARQNKEVGVIFMDLDHFKVVNDTLGHTAGDNLLKQAATRLTKCVREIDTVARLGGDEFLLILSQGSAERLDVTPVTTRILSRFAEVF
ncbi:MAG: diguanylate cyclase, partial [Gammaproteobacteria bacterium]|nr:diguanylate cyclase [Gammaproteobacteria bacterium]